MTDQEQQEWDMKMKKLDAEISNLYASTSEINQNMKYRFWVLGAAYVGALAVILKFL